MNTVLLYGSDSETQITNTLLGAIKAADMCALHITAKTFSIFPPMAQCPDFLVIDQSKIPQMQMGNGIVVFKQGLSYFQKGYNIPKNFFAVVDPENEEAVAMLRKNCMQTITCGLSQKDSVTFSSINQDGAVVSLQRGLVRLDGKLTEPEEVPVKFNSSHSQYAVLAAVAVLLLSGAVNSETVLTIL